MTDHQRLHNLRRRVNRARNASGVTCAASRHVHMVADSFATGKLHILQEPQFIAESLYSVLESLWKCRAAKVKK